MTRRDILLFVPLSLLVGCGQEKNVKAEATRQRLVGTWLREVDEDGMRMRRVVVLSADKSFKEMAKLARKDGTIISASHAGEWFFDGTYFKRKYTEVDGRQQNSSGITLATLRLEPSENDEIVGVDDSRKVTFRYRRVEPGTEP